jgi:hypothetical protein
MKYQPEAQATGFDETRRLRFGLVSKTFIALSVSYHRTCRPN